MMNAKLVKAITTAGLVVLCAGCLFACSNSSGASGVAATVNGTEIPEADVTAQIENVRSQVIVAYQQSDETKTEEDAWGEYLVAIGETPESMREEVIDSKVDSELVKSGAADKGVVVDEAEVDRYVEEMSSHYGSQEEWEKILAQAGFDEESYRETIRTSLMNQGLQESFSESAKADDATVLETAQSYLSYYNGAKRSSHILFKVEDTTDEKAMEAARKEAQEVLDKINSGEIDFADAAKEYSDDSSADNGGDVGWDRLSSFVTEYTTALDGLELDQVSGLVETDYGVHIIKCTEVFTAPEELTSIDQIPEDFRSEIEEMADSTAVNDAYDAWVEELKEQAEIVVNPMPADVPYNIDLTPYEQTDEDEEAIEDETDEGAEDEDTEDAEEADAEAEAETETADAETADADAAAAETSPAE